MKSKCSFNANAIISIILMIAVFSSNDSFGQDSILWSVPFKNEKTNPGSLNYFAGSDGINLYFGGWKNGKQRILRKIDANLKEAGAFYFSKKETEVSSGLKYETEIFFGNKLYVLFSENSKSENYKKLFAEVVDTSSMTKKGERIQLLKSEFQPNSYTYEDKYTFALSPNRQYLMIVKSFEPEKKQNANFILSILNEQMEKVIENKIELQINSKEFSANEFVVDNSGNYFIVGKKTVTSSKGENYSLIINSFMNGKSNVVTELAIEKPIRKFNATLGHNGNLIITAFYFGSNQPGTEGLYLTLFDPREQRILINSHKMLDKKKVSKYLTASEIRETENKKLLSRDTILDQFIIKETIINEDGGFIVVGQAEFDRIYEPVSNDLVLIKYDAKGNELWNAIISKRSKPGYVSFVNGQDVSFFYRDYFDNLEIENNGIIKTSGKIYSIFMTTVDKDGKISRKAILNDKDKVKLWNANLSAQIKENQIMLLFRSEFEITDDVNYQIGLYPNMIN